MAEQAGRRRRQQYSKLICLGCRTRRIRCALPDTSIQPSIQPQPADKACQRCRQNGLDCIVDYTTLGRPAQKRSRLDKANVKAQQHHARSSSDAALSDNEFRDSAAQDVDDFLLSHPETSQRNGSAAQEGKRRPTRAELCESMTSAFHLLSALLSRDKNFASRIGSQPLVKTSVLELIDEDGFALLDAHLVWHKLNYPDVPSLPQLCDEVKSAELGLPQHTSGVFLLTLLCDLALDVPSNRLASLKHLQDTIRALVYHSGQKLFFSLARNSHTVLALALTAQYRPLALTSSQVASSHTLKAIPHIILAKYVAAELGYNRAGARLAQALSDTSISADIIRPLMHQCFHWIRLSIAEDVQTGPFNDWIRRIDPTALECLDALRTALLLNQLPIEMLLPYSSISYSTQMLANLRDMTEHWKDLNHLEEVIHGHRVFCDRERDILDQVLQLHANHGEVASVVSQLADMERQFSHIMVVGCALFFAVMSAVYAQSHQGAIRLEQAVGISDNIITQLLGSEETDPDRPDSRKFLEEYGSTRMDELERALTNFITAVDTLTLEGIPYVGRTRDAIGAMVFVCKDIVEGNAARMKGWAGLHERVDVQMILFIECARWLEAMSASAGTEEALSRGCILTGGARLIRSLHRILQGFKKTVAESSRRSTSDSSSNPNQITPPESDGMSTWDASGTIGSSDCDTFADWDNWPHFEAMDFSDLLGSTFNFDVNDVS